MTRVITGICLCLAFGCSDSSGTTINGTVTFSDGTALSQGVIVLTSETNSFRGSINSDGTYEIPDVLDGTYAVAITGTTVGRKPPLYDDLEYDESTALYVDTTPKDQSSEGTALISARFGNPNTSDLSISVPGEYDLTVAPP